jgi:cysteine-rich repeat protein
MNFSPLKFLRNTAAAALLSVGGCIIFFNGFVVCGDGIVANNEDCDDGNRIGGDGCDEFCFLENDFCGDGFLDFNEVCDDGNRSDGDGCSADCDSFEVCGDGILNFNEDCDDANNIDGDGCNSDCTLSGSCGNSIVDVGEACDDGNLINGDGCSATCAGEFCGDGIIAVNEECDDGAANSNAPNACRQDCVLPFCGDDVVDAGEQCDNGINNSDTAPGACRTNCVFRFCGDGVKDGVEQCDDGNTQSGDGCDAVCHTEVLCGDNTVQANESCDGSNLNGQTCQTLGFSGGVLTCAVSCDDFDATGCFFCGDGNVDPGEECDDANAIDNDACSNNCTFSIEICNNVDDNGNGVFDEGCDDDNDDFCDANVAKQAGVFVATCPLSNPALAFGDDCNDNSAQFAPGNFEICDNLDNDCDDPDGVNIPASAIDEGCDDDNDGFCDAAATKAAGVVVATCSLTPAAANIGDDCNDTNASVNPSAGNCP